MALKWGKRKTETWPAVPRITKWCIPILCHTPQKCFTQVSWSLLLAAELGLIVTTELGTGVSTTSNRQWWWEIIRDIHRESVLPSVCTTASGGPWMYDGVVFLPWRVMTVSGVEDVLSTECVWVRIAETETMSFHPASTGNGWLCGPTSTLLWNQQKRRFTYS